MRLNDGYAIFRLDERTPASFREYSDPEAQEQISRSITMSLAQAAEKSYISELRDKAHIEVCGAKR